MTMIGADPEAVVLSRATKLAVSVGGILTDNVYPTLGEKGHQNLGWGQDIGAEGSMLELRPAPAKTAVELVQKIRTLLFRFNYGSGGKYSIRGGSSFLPNALTPNSLIYMGGHIHLDAHGDYKASSGFSVRRGDAEQMLRRLDYVLGVPFALIEDPAEREARVKIGYGNFDGHRWQQWGPEYRTPSSWLVSQLWATRVLCLAERVAKMEKEHDYLDKLPKLEAFTLTPADPNNYTSEQCRRVVKPREYLMKAFTKYTYPVWADYMKTDPAFRGLLKDWVRTINGGKSWYLQEDALLLWGIPDPIGPKIVAERSVEDYVRKAVEKVMENIQVQPGKKMLWVHSRPGISRQRESGELFPVSVRGIKSPSKLAYIVEAAVKDLNSQPGVLNYV